jgi:Putative transmembrane protein (PGPGW)
MDYLYLFTDLSSASVPDHFRNVATWLALLSLFTLFLSLILLPYVVRKIPSDYFLKLSKEQPRLKGYDLKSVLILLFRNILGMLLLVSGIAMLFLPGQGLITIFVSLLLMNFPGKRRFVTYLTSKKSVQKSINWIRKKAKKNPIKWPQEK